MNDDRMTGERVAVHRYADEVLVEVVVDEGDGDVRTVSTAFEVVDPERGTLAPREAIPSTHADRIRRHIEASEYVLADSRTPSA